MGEVYRATDTRGTMFAVKFLTGSYARKAAIMNRFRAAASVQSSLEHPNICPVHEIHREGAGREGVVMKWVDGHPLEDELAQFHRLPWNFHEVMAVMGPVLHAVSYAHSRGIVHRDLKPGNVLLERVAGGSWPGIPLLIDFDLVKLTGKEVQNHTQDGTKMGTPPYMAPEQFMASKNIDERADVFALGVMFRYLLTGRLVVKNPSDGVELADLYTGRSPIPSLIEDKPNLNADFIQVIDDAVSLDPSHRPSDAGAMLRRIKAITAGLTSYPPVSTMGGQDSGWEDNSEHGSDVQSTQMKYDGAPTADGYWTWIIFGFIFIVLALSIYVK